MTGIGLLGLAVAAPALHGDAEYHTPSVGGAEVLAYEMPLTDPAHVAEPWYADYGHGFAQIVAVASGTASADFTADAYLGDRDASAVMTAGSLSWPL